MRSRTCSSDSPHSFHAYTTPGPSLRLAIASASASILALSFSICGLVTIGPSPRFGYDHEKNLKVLAAVPNRFARDLIVQETLHRMLKAQGIEIIAADSPGAFVEDTPTATLVRQVLGAVAQFDKAMTVAKLRLARDRVRNRDGKCEGRKSHAEERPEAVALAKQLHKQGMGYRAISGELAKAGHVNERGK